MSESEPSMTYRKIKVLSEPGSPVALGGACEQPAYCTGGNRYIGGMSPRQALVWNMGSCTAMLRETHKREELVRRNTDASGRGGATRSSMEASVMGVERRGCVIQLIWIGQPKIGMNR